MFDGFEDQHPDVTIDYQPISGDYAQARIADFAAGTPPDAFYVNSDVAAEWIREDFLLPLDDYIQRTGFDTGPFYEPLLDAFRGEDTKMPFGPECDAPASEKRRPTKLAPWRSTRAAAS